MPTLRQVPALPIAVARAAACGGLVGLGTCLHWDTLASAAALTT